MEKKHVVFLTGAGAEGTGQLGLPSGNGFKRDIILSQNVAALGNHFLSDISLKNGTIITSNSSSILYQTIIESEKFEDVLVKLFPDEAGRQQARAYCEYKAGSKEFDTDEKKEITSAFQKLYFDRFYTKIKDGIVDDSVEYFLQHAGIYSFLDSMFNYLRKPMHYKKECARIIKVYFSALNSILNGMEEYLGADIPEDCKDLKELLLSSDKSGIAPKYCDALYNLIEYLQNAIYEKFFHLSTDEKPKIYYGVIRQLLDSNQEITVSCITTNYTDIAERIIGLNDDSMAYLHGRLAYFEDLETKKIDKVCNLTLCKNIFPYLLVQSGVKPIISSYQIEEFSKANTWLKTADYLIIIGYGINSDDEHINNLLRTRLSLNKRIVYFIHCQKDDKSDFVEKKKWVENQLGEDSVNLVFYDTDQFSDVLKNLTEE